MREFDVDVALQRAIQEPGTRRAEILRAGERLFAERGFEGVRVRDVADLASVNVATVHLHWKSKAVLYEAVCRLHAKQLFEFAKQLASEGTGGGAGRRRYVKAAVDFMADHPYIASLALQSVADQTPPEIPSLFSHDLSAFRAAEELVRKQELQDPEGDPTLTVLAVFYFAAVLFCDSPLQQALLGGSVYADADTRERVARFAELLVGRLVGPSS